MKTLNDYMNDPSVTHLQMPLREVKAIRLMIYDEQKNMTSEELKTYYMQKAERLKRDYNISVVASAN